MPAGSDRLGVFLRRGVATAGFTAVTAVAIQPALIEKIAQVVAREVPLT